VVKFDPAITLSPGQSHVMGKIVVSRPLAQNAAWSVSHKLIEEEKSRLKTNLACTSVKLNTNTSGCTQSGDLSCAPGLATLSVQANTASCAEKHVRVGLEATAGQLNLLGIDLELDFTSDPGVEISRFDFGDFLANPSQICIPGGTGCVGGSSSTCYQFTGNKLIICVNFGTPHVLTGKKYMNVYFNGGQKCVNNITVTRTNILTLNTSPIACVPDVNLDNSKFPICGSGIGGTITMENNVPVEEVDVTLSGNSCSNPSFCSKTNLTTEQGIYGFCENCTCGRKE
jgi:hypothetical protein